MTPPNANFIQFIFTQKKSKNPFPAGQTSVDIKLNLILHTEQSFEHLLTKKM